MTKTRGGVAIYAPPAKAGLIRINPGMCHFVPSLGQYLHPKDQSPGFQELSSPIGRLFICVAKFGGFPTGITPVPKLKYE